MNISWEQIGWIVLTIFQLALTGHFLYLYKIDLDKRKLMFGIAFFIASFTHLMTALEIQNTTNELLMLKNLYYWTIFPTIIAIFSVAHYTLFKVKKFTLFFNLFLGLLVFSFLFFIVLPFPARGTISFFTIGFSIEIIIVLLLLFIIKKD